jgi:hypothetical protein
MSYNRLLTNEQILQAKELREKFGYTKKELAIEFNVAPTTIWYNIYGRKRKTKRIYNYKKAVYKYVDINGFLIIVENLRKKGLTSAQVAQVFDVPIEQINKIWCKTL